jgi:hypothetical protein
MDFLDTLPPLTDEDRALLESARKEAAELPLPVDEYERFNPLVMDE